MIKQWFLLVVVFASGNNRLLTADTTPALGAELKTATCFAAAQKSTPVVKKPPSPVEESPPLVVEPKAASELYSSSYSGPISSSEPTSLVVERCMTIADLWLALRLHRAETYSKLPAILIPVSDLPEGEKYRNNPVWSLINIAAILYKEFGDVVPTIQAVIDAIISRNRERLALDPAYAGLSSDRERRKFVAALTIPIV